MPKTLEMGFTMNLKYNISILIIRQGSHINAALLQDWVRDSWQESRLLLVLAEFL